MKRILSLKGIFCMMAIALVIELSSCEKESNVMNEKPVDNMEMFFIESKGLPETSMDSVTSFISKFSTHIKTYPESQRSEYFNPTVDNMSYACSVFGYKLVVHTGVGITINDEWDGEYLINF